MKLLTYLSLFFCTLVEASTQHTCGYHYNLDWNLWKSNTDYSVSTARMPNKQSIALQAKITLPTKINHFYQFLHHEESVALWLARAENVEITQLAKNQSMITTYFSGGFFISPRVMQATSTVTTHTERIMVIKVENKPTPITLPESSVLMTLHFGCWNIKQLSPTELEVTYQFSASANGNIPTWVANKVAKKSLWKSLEKLQQHFAD
ncbi:hypothetical protein Q4489_07580 [Thalassotalea sp. 1_MG-2023]|uniref:hypothetical protein n=1 Tax=Thalassotalea sp. 1_MG-2023 TaxID=3062680 RepID=UPI0026E2F1F0|nr:hypothetical protein [Thalassotalea sp. 1_MG-2023]MDO6426865.1 hypothetical protein [Thalassotalea sp. 1_MG-2023]